MARSIFGTLSALITALDRAVRTLPPDAMQDCLDDLVQRVGAALERTRGREAPTRHQTEDEPPHRAADGPPGASAGFLGH